VGAFSAATAAVTLVAHRLGGLAGRVVLVIGAGQVGRRVLAESAKLRPASLLVASRSVRHAHDAAQSCGARAMGLTNIGEVLAGADAVITATTARDFVIDAAVYEAAASAEPDRPRLLVDLSVPPVVDPMLAASPGVTLYATDDLGDIVRASNAKRRGEVAAVDAIVTDEARRAFLQFQTRVARTRAVVPPGFGGDGPLAAERALTLANLRELQQHLDRGRQLSVS
jgi:glutamyl-tRNA reductase